MKNLILISLFSFSLPLLAKGKAALTVQPVVGLERVQKLSPVQKTKTRTIVGARAMYGVPRLSLEAQVTRAEDSETLYDRNLTEKEESYNAMLGIRSSFNVLFANWYLRAGGHARKSTYTTTQNGVTTTRDPAIYLSPYAGTGLSVNILGKFFANAGVTVIFTGRPKGSDQEYQTTLGFGVRI